MGPISLFNDFEHLLDDFRVQSGAAAERNRDSQNTLAVDAMTAFGTQQLADHRGTLGIHFYGSGQNFSA
jgi:hypothetical protein